MKGVQKTIPVVYLSSQEFSKILSVSLASLLEHAASDTMYDVRVLVHKCFSPQHETVLTALVEKYGHAILRFVEMNDAFIHTKTNYAGVGKESLYRLMIPELFPEIDKCIYLDADTLVLDDLSEMFAFEMGNDYIAGVYAERFLHLATQNFNKAHYNKFATMLQKSHGVFSYDQYVGAGVMVMNLAALRSDNMTRTFLSYVLETSVPLDQDILNACCYGKIRKLPVAFCVDMHDLAEIAWYEENRPEQMPQILAALERPVVVHYADRFKPWLTLGLRYEVKWWRYAFANGVQQPLWETLLENTAVPDTWYKQELTRVTNSKAYKLGKALVWLPQRILGR